MNLKARLKLFETLVDADATKGADVLGGRSMGARAAVMAADGSGIRSLVLVSYPLISPKGDVRDEILLKLDKEVDVLFISGEGDGMCDFKKLEQIRKDMKATTWLVTVRAADHGMGVKGAGKVGTEAVGIQTGKIAAEWASETGRRDSEGRQCEIWWDKEAGTARQSGWVVERWDKVVEKEPSKNDVEREEQVQLSTTSRRGSKKRKHAEAHGEIAETGRDEKVGHNAKRGKQEGKMERSTESRRRIKKPKDEEVREEDTAPEKDAGSAAEDNGVRDRKRQTEGGKRSQPRTKSKREGSQKTPDKQIIVEHRPVTRSSVRNKAR